PILATPRPIAAMRPAHSIRSAHANTAPLAGFIFKNRQSLPRLPIFKSLFNTALLPPESGRPPSEDSAPRGRPPHGPPKSAYRRNQFPSSFSAADLQWRCTSFLPVLPVHNSRGFRLKSLGPYRFRRPEQTSEASCS